MNKLIHKSMRFFSLFGTGANQSLIRSSIHSPLSTQQRTVQPQGLQYQQTQLDNGVTVLTESVTVPSNVHLGVFVDAGTRDETAESSGAMLSLKNTYLKTAINTSETVNYGITQMSGGAFEMDYTRQSSYYCAHCLSHDVVDVFGMVADSAFEPKNYVSSSVGMYKNARSHQLENFLGGNEQFQDAIYQAAYGRRGLGNPIQGYRSNVSYLNVDIIQKFQSQILTPKRIVISAAGVENHDEFVDLVKQKLSSNILSAGSLERESAQYVGGQVRNLTEANNIHLVLAYEGANYRQSLPLLIASEVLGNGRRVGRIQQRILNQHVFIDSAQALNTSYSDTGLFGIKLSGSAAHARQILDIAARELSGLRDLSGADIELAKQSLKGRLNRHYACTRNRLEDRTKSLYYTGNTNENLSSEIDAVSVSQVQDAVASALRSKLTFVSRGGEVSSLPSYDSISNLVN